MATRTGDVARALDSSRIRDLAEESRAIEPNDVFGTTIFFTRTGDNASTDRRSVFGANVRIVRPVIGIAPGRA